MDLVASLSRSQALCASGGSSFRRLPATAHVLRSYGPGRWANEFTKSVVYPLLPPTQSQQLQRNAHQVRAAKQTYSSFDDLLNNSDAPVLVDFYATWCGPCQFMVPVLNDVSQALKDKIRVVKIDSEKYPNIASRYGVQALPTLMLFQAGRPIDRLEGAMTASELIKRIEGVLSALKAKARD